MVGCYPDRGLIIVDGKGPYLFNDLGNRYLDLMTNYGVNIFGYRHPILSRVLAEQAAGLTTLHGSFSHEPGAEAARLLVERCGGGLAQVFFSNSGSEAVEAALKFSVTATGKRRFIAFYGGFHGKTLGALSATHGDKYRRPFEPLLWDFQHVAYNDLDALKEVLDKRTAAVILEPIQGESGIQIPSPDYLLEVRRLCNEYGVILILDEVQSGAGRTGYLLASQSSKISYDIVCLGKGLAGGIPIGATLVSGVIAKSIPKSIHTSTFGGNPLAAVGILTTLNLLTPECLNTIQSMGDYFRERLAGAALNRILSVRGRGFMLAIDVSGSRSEVLQELQRNGILAIPAGEQTVRFLPPYILKKYHIDFTIDILERILSRDD